MYKLLVTVLLLTSVQAQDLSFEELENLPSDTINSQNEEDDFFVIEALTEQRETVEKSRTIILPPPALPKVEDRPNAFRAVIPAGTVITRLSDDKDFITPKQIQLWAQEIQTGSQTCLLLDKNKKPIFSAKSIDVVPVESDLALTPDINPKITYDRSSARRFSAYEKNIHLQNDFSWELENIAPNFWNQVFEQDMPNGSGTRFSLASFYKSETLPLDFGLSVSYMKAQASSEEFQIDWSGIFIGPQLSYSMWQGELWGLDINAGAAGALFSSARTDEFAYSPSYYEWGLGAKLSRKALGGKIFAGANYRQTRISLDEFTSETTLTTQKETQTSISFSIGYRFGLTL